VTGASCRQRRVSRAGKLQRSHQILCFLPKHATFRSYFANIVEPFGQGFVALLSHPAAMVNLGRHRRAPMRPERRLAPRPGIFKGPPGSKITG
jgi:hypothetical protein